MENSPPNVHLASSMLFFFLKLFLIAIQEAIIIVAENCMNSQFTNHQAFMAMHD